MPWFERLIARKLFLMFNTNFPYFKCKPIHNSWENNLYPSPLQQPLHTEKNTLGSLSLVLPFSTWTNPVLSISPLMFTGSWIHFILQVMSGLKNTNLPFEYEKISWKYQVPQGNLTSLRNYDTIIGATCTPEVVPVSSARWKQDALD